MNNNQSEKNSLQTKPVLLDGAFGTCLWEEAEKRNIEKTPTWMYNVDHPDLLEYIVREYSRAGSEIIYSNTFVATNPEISSAGYSLKEVIETAMKIVRNNHGGKMAYSIGPLMKMMEPYGNMTRQQAEDVYRESIDIAYGQDPDMIILETFMDLNMLEVAAKVALETKLPVFCTMSFLNTHRTLLGNSIDEMVGLLEPMGISAVGMNCSVGPESAAGIIEEFAEKTKLPLILKPNATKPRESQKLHAADNADKKSGIELESYTPDEFVSILKPAFGNVSFIGACCGSSPDFIRALAENISA